MLFSIKKLFYGAGIVIGSVIGSSPASAADSTPLPAGQHAVLVTGASSGIGRKITEYLSAKGVFVYAGARKETDLQSLSNLKNVQPIRLDVTKPEDIKAAVDTIAKAGQGLYGLVNNAGVVSYGPVLNVDPQEYDRVMAVNMAGPFRMSQAFAPLITEQKGRIITIGSIIGVSAGKDIGIYAMSKFAVEGFTDSFAEEMAPAGVDVIVVEPGTYKSEINENAAARKGEKLANETRSWVDALKEPDEVAAAVERALFEPKPKRRYMVVPVEEQHKLVIEKQIERLVQLNEGQPYTYDRATLVKMLDTALAKSRPRTAK